MSTPQQCYDEIYNSHEGRLLQSGNLSYINKMIGGQVRKAALVGCPAFRSWSSRVVSANTTVTNDSIYVPPNHGLYLEAEVGAVRVSAGTIDANNFWGFECIGRPRGVLGTDTRSWDFTLTPDTDMFNLTSTLNYEISANVSTFYLYLRKNGAPPNISGIVFGVQAWAYQ